MLLSLFELNELKRLLSQAIEEHQIFFWDHEDAEDPTYVHDIRLTVEDHRDGPSYIDVYQYDKDFWGL
jgi:hypothetical protein